jgi:peptidyl-prolyl cis-trans isomerase B (cyclophilin B)
VRRLLPLTFAAVLVLSACGGGEDESGTGNGCEDVDAPEPKPDGGRQPPREQLDAYKTYQVALETNCGTFTIELDLDSAPETAASFVALAEDGFFDDTTFHRIVPGFVIQGGDPTGTGRGGPGYQTVDRPMPNARYTKGVVAMAKSPADPPGAAGSQFFVVTGEDVGLPPEYAVLGRVVEGLDVVERIGQLGDPETEEPTQTVVVRSMTVSTS